MIIENRWFVLQGPRRVDLSSRPWGWLLIWLGGSGVQDHRTGGRFQRNPCTREFGFYLPIPGIFSTISKFFPKKIEVLECVQLLDQEDYLPNDLRQWPAAHLKSATGEATHAMQERPGSKIIFERSYCDRRADLSGRPLQLIYSIVLKLAA